MDANDVISRINNAIQAYNTYRDNKPARKYPPTVHYSVEVSDGKGHKYIIRYF